MKSSLYPELASEFLRGASLFIREFPTKTKDCLIGSKVVRVTIPREMDEGAFDLLGGLIESTKVPYADYDLVLFHGRFADFSPELSIFKDTDRPLGQVRTELSYPTRIAHDLHSNSVVIYDPDSATAVVWVEEPSQYPYWARATPFRLALSWIADSFDGEFLHGALLALDGRGLMMAGRSGAGKSTTSIAAMSEGFDLISDDFFLYEQGKLFPVYTRAKLHDSSLAILPIELRTRVLNPDLEGEKRILQLDVDLLSKYRNGIEVENFVIPNLGPSTAFQEVTLGAILHNLAPYTLAGLLGGTARSMLRMKRAISSGRGWSLSLSPDLKANSLALKEIIAMSGA